MPVKKLSFDKNMAYSYLNQYISMKPVLFGIKLLIQNSIKLDIEVYEANNSISSINIFVLSIRKHQNNAKNNICIETIILYFMFLCKGKKFLGHGEFYIIKSLSV